MSPAAPRHITLPTLQTVRKQHGPLKNAKELEERAMSLTDRIALVATKIVGSMGFFYACVIMVTVPLLLPKTMVAIQYVSSGYLQLILLPLIMVGQNLLGRHGEIRAENDFQVNMKAEREIEVLYQHLEYQNAILLAMMVKLDISVEDALAAAPGVAAMEGNMSDAIHNNLETPEA
jgi:uncharacterized membrane protein